VVGDDYADGWARGGEQVATDSAAYPVAVSTAAARGERSSGLCCRTCSATQG
jgi:hypothetical protein